LNAAVGFDQETLTPTYQLRMGVPGASAGLNIAERLAAFDPSNTQWQRDLSISYSKIGDVMTKQGKLDEALKAYRDGLAIAERLAKDDPSNAVWQRDLSASYSEIGDAMTKQGKTQEALASYRKALEIMEPLAAADPTNVLRQADIIEYNRGLAINGDDPARRFAFILAALRRLQTLTKLTDEQNAWLSEAETQLAKVTSKSVSGNE